MINLGEHRFVSSTPNRRSRRKNASLPDSVVHSNTNTITEILPGQKKGSTTAITSAVKVPELVEDSQLTILPSFVPPTICNAMKNALLDSNSLRQYSRGDTWDEPRIHALYHDDATSNNMQTAGIGYVYKDVQMKAAPMDTVSGLSQFSQDFGKSLSVEKWRLGVECVLYGSCSDGMGFHADDSQGETIIAALILEDNGDQPRTVTIKPKGKYETNYSAFQLQLSQGSVYIMNGEMQKHYMHALKKSSRELIDQRRVILVFRDGNERETIDNGTAASVDSRRHKKSPVLFGNISGIVDGEVLFHRSLMKTYGHRIGSKGVNGNMFVGCDAIIISRNDPELDERDGK